jgi:hypothetical protein
VLLCQAKDYEAVSDADHIGIILPRNFRIERTTQINSPYHQATDQYPQSSKYNLKKRTNLLDVVNLEKRDALVLLEVGLHFGTDCRTEYFNLSIISCLRPVQTSNNFPCFPCKRTKPYSLLRLDSDIQSHKPQTNPFRRLRKIQNAAQLSNAKNDQPPDGKV